LVAGWSSFLEALDVQPFCVCVQKSTQHFKAPLALKTPETTGSERKLEHLSGSGRSQEKKKRKGSRKQQEEEEPTKREEKAAKHFIYLFISFLLLCISFRGENNDRGAFPRGIGWLR
jgi:hypothetical protein